ncbi:MAG: FAD-dependent oxidoreductase [Firmicutes bacterium]|jgi:thioredoxin reductase (NADPH)|nr:FAD-dependent oxidoreductase [Bacillota bacterium]
MIFPLIIIGGGPAGLSAALYAKRLGVDLVILEKGVPGGQLLMTEKVENYPGAGLITGNQLADTMVLQLNQLGIKIEERVEVESIEIENRIKILKTTKGEWRGETVIIATGSTPRKLEVPGEKELTGKGVSYCSLCDAPFFKNKDVVVAGGGDSAVGESLYISQYARKITIVHHREKLSSEWILQKLIKGNYKIRILQNSVVKSISGYEKVEGVEIQNLQTGEFFSIKADGLFVFIGSIPQTKFLKGLNLLDADLTIPTDEKMRTFIPGIFAAGEVRSGSLKQIVTSCSDGAAAAIQAKEYLRLNC